MNLFRRKRSSDNYDVIDIDSLDIKSKLSRDLQDFDLEFPDTTILSTIHPKDGMIKQNPKHYLEVGFEACRIIRSLALQSGIDADKPLTFLDLPCGFGRVARWVKAFFPNSSLYVSDVMPDAQSFCASSFEGIEVNCYREIERIKLPEDIDIIWVGSLFTHLPLSSFKKYMKLLLGALSPKGLLVFTTHGTLVKKRLLARERTYNLNLSGVNKILSELEETGFGFAPYDENGKYGISLFDPPELFRLLGEHNQYRVFAFIERGWDNHQDMMVMSRKAESIESSAGGNECPVCSSKNKDFVPVQSRSRAKCSICGSLERDRFMFLFSKNYTGIKHIAGFNVLYINPKPRLTRAFQDLGNISMKSLILNNSTGMFETDLSTNEDRSFDLVICSYVLDKCVYYVQVLNYLRNVLRDSGMLILQVPQFKSHPYTHENNNIIDEDGRLREYGDRHTRRIFGLNDLKNKVTRIGFSVRQYKVDDIFTNVEVARYGLFSTDIIYLCRK